MLIAMLGCNIAAWPDLFRTGQPLAGAASTRSFRLPNTAVDAGHRSRHSAPHPDWVADQLQKEIHVDATTGYENPGFVST